MQDAFFFVMGGVFSALGLIALFGGSATCALLCACITVACMVAQAAYLAIKLFVEEE